MGTRALIIVKDSEGKKDLLTLYNQFDGYLSGLGLQLEKFLKQRVLVDGYTGARKDKLIEANGMGCLAAQLLTTLKTQKGKIGPGSVYVQAHGSKNMGEEYIYVIAPTTVSVGSFDVKVLTIGEDDGAGCTLCLYSGPVLEFHAKRIETLKAGAPAHSVVTK